MPDAAGVSVRPCVSTELPKTVPCLSNLRLNFNGIRLARKPALVDDPLTAHTIKMATGVSELRVTSLLSPLPVYQNKQNGLSFRIRWD